MKEKRFLILMSAVSASVLLLGIGESYAQPKSHDAQSIQERRQNRQAIRQKQAEIVRKAEEARKLAEAKAAAEKAAAVKETVPDDTDAVTAISNDSSSNTTASESEEALTDTDVSNKTKEGTANE